MSTKCSHKATVLRLSFENQNTESNESGKEASFQEYMHYYFSFRPSNKSLAITVQA